MTAAPTATATLPDASREAELERLRRFARMMDSLIDVPLLNVRVGLDGLIGLVPVYGDAVSAVVSCYVPYRAYRLGAPPRIVARMILNVVIDAVIGLVPIIGDYLDVRWNANERNVELLEEYLENA